jgi:hypothetical protein
MNKIGLLFCLALLFSCEREYNDNEFLGNSLNDQFGELTINSPLLTNLPETDFIQLSQQSFSASWSKNANYELRIIGENSNAIKTFSGFANSLNSENSLWRGEADDFPSFQKENCMAILSINDPDTTIYDTVFINIIETKLPPTTGLYVIQDFENDQDWTLSYETNGSDMDFSLQDDMPAVGQNYFSMRGSVPWNEWRLGEIKVNVETDLIPNITPSNLILNTAIKGPNSDIIAEDQFLEIIITESDDDQFVKQIRPIDWSGWRRIAIPYSEFDPVSEGAVRESHKIANIQYMCLSCPGVLGPQGGCEANLGVLVVTDIDFISFTENEPYQP